MLGARRTSAIALGTFLLQACGGSSDKASALEFSVHEVDRLTTRMSEGAVEEALEPHDIGPGRLAAATPDRRIGPPSP